MLLANYTGKLIEAQPNMIASCPHCDDIVISKCGEINAWHWAHKTECKYHTEPETEWHFSWKQRAISFGLQIEFGFERHITDAIDVTNKICYEFQYSPISRLELVDRVIHYKSNGYITKSIFDYKQKYLDGQLLLTFVDNNVIKFQQKWAKRTIVDIYEGKSIMYGIIYFDVGDYKILVKKLYENGNGWGYLVDTKYILNNNIGGKS
jgi:competence CoiA-like predicted nuclease